MHSIPYEIDAQRNDPSPYNVWKASFHAAVRRWHAPLRERKCTHLSISTATTPIHGDRKGRLGTQISHNPQLNSTTSRDPAVVSKDKPFTLTTDRNKQMAHALISSCPMYGGRFCQPHPQKGPLKNSGQKCTEKHFVKLQSVYTRVTSPDLTPEICYRPYIKFLQRRNSDHKRGTQKGLDPDIHPNLDLTQLAYAYAADTKTPSTDQTKSPHPYQNSDAVPQHSEILPAPPHTSPMTDSNNSQPTAERMNLNDTWEAPEPLL